MHLALETDERERYKDWVRDSWLYSKQGKIIL
jgi:hypothetical protein